MLNGPLTGKRIRTLIPDCDLDENSVQRDIPIGTCGTIREIAAEEEPLYAVYWDNGAVTLWNPEEIAKDAEEVSHA